MKSIFSTTHTKNGIWHCAILGLPKAFPVKNGTFHSTAYRGAPNFILYLSILLTCKCKLL